MKRFVDLENLVRRVAEVEDKISRLLKLCDPNRHPFTYWSFEMNLTSEQVRQIYALMDEAHGSLSSSQNPMTRNVFEQRVSEILHQPRSHAHAESIVRMFNQSGEYTDVYQCMRDDGMPI